MNSTEVAGRNGLPLSILSGLLLALAYPSPDLGPVAFIALTPFLLSLADVSSAGALARGYACGVSFFVPLLYWIVRVLHLHGGLPWVVSGFTVALLVFYLATYVALFAVITAASWRRFGPLTLVAAPVFWVGLELARGRLLSGFPWGLLGYSQHRNLPLLQAASFAGIYAVSFLVLAANAAIALALARGASPAARRAAIGLALLVGGVWVGGGALLRFDRSSAALTAFPVAAIQGNVAQHLKWEAEAAEPIVTDLLRLTREAAAKGVQVIVWPESSSPYSFYRPVRATGGEGGGVTIEPYTGYLETITDLVRELGVTLIAGSVDYRFADGRLRAYNSAFVIATDGSMGTPYDKVRLVPFGEYVPLRNILFFINRLVGGAIAEFDSGSRFSPLPTPAGPAATFICYEAIFPEIVRRLGRGSTFLVNLTNDAWFGRSAAPEQHLAMAAVRAVENRRYLVRAANTGISAIVDPYGRIVARTRLGESAILVGSIEPRRGATPYALAGDVFAGGCAILTLLHAAALRVVFRSPAA